MIKKIKIFSEIDDVEILEGNKFTVTHGNMFTSNEIVTFKIKDDSTVTIPIGNYDLLEIETECGDFKIILENTFFDNIKIKSETGDVEITANYNNISFDSECGEYINHKKVNNAKKHKTINGLSTIKVVKPKEVNSFAFNRKRVAGERYE